jgi:hypothetical protein
VAHDGRKAISGVDILQFRKQDVIVDMIGKVVNYAYFVPNLKSG